MKTIKTLSILVLLLAITELLNAQTYPLQVQVTPKAKFTPFLAEFKANPGEYISLRVSSASPNTQGTRNIYFAIKMQQLAPNRNVSLSSNYNKKPLVPTTINNQGSNIITPNQMKNAFEGYSENDFVYTGIEKLDINNINAGTRLPEGIYQLCIIAMDYDVPIGKPPVELSNPNASCCQITICYSASEPIIIQPINAMIMPESNYIKKNISTRKIINFQWTAPISTCGLNLNSTTYDFKLTNLLPSQSEDDAIRNNPPLIRRENLPSTSLLIDTSAYTFIFQKGNTYVVQITAKSNNPAIDVKNNGNSKVCSFVYGNAGLLNIERNKDQIELSDLKDSNKKDDSEGEEKDIKNIMQMMGVGLNIDCGVPPPSNLNLNESIKVGDEIKVGNFSMNLSSVTKKSPGIYSGTGVIPRPTGIDLGSFNWVSVSVKFDSLAINENKEAISGLVYGVSIDETSSDYSNFFGSFGIKNNDFVSKYLNEATNQKSTKSFNKFIKKFQEGGNLSCGKASMPSQKFPLQVGLEGYDVAISNMVFSPKGAVMSLLLFCEVPEADMSLCFGAFNVCMNSSFNKNMRISLLSPIEFAIGDGNKMRINASNENTTYMQWANSRFDHINIGADIILSKEKYVNIDNKNNPVEIKFSTTFKKWDDWIAKISINKFAVKGYEDLSFEVQEAIYDHSSRKDDESYINAINSMQNTIKADHNENVTFKSGGIFKGVFIKKAEVNLPNIITSSDNQPIVAVFENAMLNEDGFTTVIRTNKLIDISTGSLGGWAFSVDAFKVFFYNSNFKSASLNGEFAIPLLKGNLSYTLLMDKNNGSEKSYSFVVNSNNVKSDFLKYITINIENSSKIEGKYINNDFQLSAELNGSLNIVVKDIGLDIKAMKFEKIRFANYDRYGKRAFDFSWGNLQTGIGGGEKGTGKSSGKNKNIGNSSSSNTDYSFEVAGFAAGISNVKFNANPSKSNPTGAFEIGIELPIFVKLGEGKLSIRGDVTSDITTVVKYKFQNQRFKFDDLDVKYNLSKVSVDSKIGPVEIAGSIEIFKDHKTFGDGFLGSVSCNLPMDIGVFATVQFGKVMQGGSKMQYWYVDAGANFGEKGIDIVPPIALSGVAGGVWYNMAPTYGGKQVSDENTKAEIKQNEMSPEELASKRTELENGNASTPKVGSSLSGYDYIPKKGAFGFKIQANIMSTAGKNVFNGSVALIAKFENETINEIQILGKLRAIGSGNSYAVNAEADMFYNIPDKHFHIGVRVDAKFGPVKANVPFIFDVNGKEKKFYLAVGEPFYGTDRTLRISILDFDAKIIYAKLGAEGYFVLGNALTYDLPAIPHKIQRMMNQDGKVATRTSPKDFNDKPRGGMMLGTRIEGKLGFELGPFYAKIEAMAGFDKEIKNRGDQICSNGQKLGGIGGSGLYLQGQVYAYLYGGCGVKVKFLGKQLKRHLQR